MKNSNADMIEEDSYLSSQVKKLSQKINQLLEAVFNQSPDGMMLLDYQGVLLLCNTLTHDMFAKPPQPGDTIETLFEEPNRSEVLGVMNQLQLTSLTENKSTQSLQLSLSDNRQKRVLLEIHITATRIDEETFFIVR
ncbi:MAG TPA: PAS domain-containing protein, partial [Caldithrix abyssi]|nr:PAS domain-containing protein [Caldithrix abyssi]